MILYDFCIKRSIKWDLHAFLGLGIWWYPSHLLVDLGNAETLVYRVYVEWLNAWNCWFISSPRSSVHPLLIETRPWWVDLIKLGWFLECECNCSSLYADGGWPPPSPQAQSCVSRSRVIGGNFHFLLFGLQFLSDIFTDAYSLLEISSMVMPSLVNMKCSNNV